MAIMRYSPKRVVLVTAGLALSGAVCGGLAGAAALGIAGIISDGLRSTLSSLGVLAYAGGIGATLGAVLGPAAAWLLLRRVPLGRAFAGLTIGTIVGGVAGWFLPDFTHSFYQSVYTGAAGFVTAGVWLRVRQSRAPGPDADPGVATSGPGILPRRPPS